MKLYEFVDKLYAMGDTEAPKTTKPKKVLNESLNEDIQIHFPEYDYTPEAVKEAALAAVNESGIPESEVVAVTYQPGNSYEYDHFYVDFANGDEEDISGQYINDAEDLAYSLAEVFTEYIEDNLAEDDEDDLDEDLNEALFNDNELGEYIRKHLNPELSLADVEVYNSGNYAEVQVQLEPEIYNNDGYGYTFNFVPKETSVEDFFDYVVNSLNNVSLEEGPNEKPLTESFVRQWFPSNEDYFYNDLSGIVEIKKLDTRYDDMTDEEQTLYEFSGTKDAFQYVVDNFGYFEDLEYQKKYQDDELEYSDDIANLQYSDD